MINSILIYELNILLIVIIGTTESRQLKNFTRINSSV